MFWPEFLRKVFKHFRPHVNCQWFFWIEKRPAVMSLVMNMVYFLFIDPINRKMQWIIMRKAKYLLEVNVWSHQSALQRNAFKSSAVRPTITTGGATIVRTNKPIPTQRQIIPNRFKSVASVILTALADRTRNTTEILLMEKNEEIYIIYFFFWFNAKNSIMKGKI